MHAQIRRSHLEGTAGSGRSFLENQGNILAAKLSALVNPLSLLSLETNGKINQTPDFFPGKILHLQQISSL